MRWRLWPRKFIQPNYAATSQRRETDDAYIGDTLVLGLLFLIGVFSLAASGTAGRDKPRSVNAMPGEIALSARPTAKQFAGSEPRKAHRTSLALADAPPR